MTMRCETCDEELARTSRFCSQCGMPVAARSVERRQLTILFFDLVDYTTLAHRLDPEHVQRIMRAFHACGARVLRRHGGSIARYAGDGSLAYFGYPDASEDDAERAVRAGLDLVRAVPEIEVGRGVACRARVGIATGEVVVGDVFDEGSAREITAHGEALPLASRLQTLADPDSVLVSESTHRLVEGFFELASLGRRDLKGFGEPVPLWRVVGPRSMEGRFAARASRAAPLVGRQQEMQRLEAGFARAAAGAGEVVIVGGDAGIGKSRVAAALRQSVEDAAAHVLYHQCSAESRHSAFHPLVEQIARETRLGSEEAARAKRARLDRWVEAAGLDVPRYGAVLAEMLAFPWAEDDARGGIPPDRLRADFTRLVLERVLALAREGPVVLVFEDAHWMDPSTRELLAELSRRIVDARVFVLVTARTAIGLLADAEGGARVRTFSLGRLERQACQRILESMEGGPGLPPALVDSILDRADGVPLFVEELTRAAIEVENGRNGRADLADVPLTLRDSLVARLDRLEAGREVARMAAALGREFTHGLLAAVSSLPPDALRESLDELARSEIVLPVVDASEPTFTFRHALLQDAAYDLMLHEERTQLHARIAHVIEEEFPEAALQRPERVAHHYTEAGRLERAVEYWRRAGARAAARSSFAEAIAHFERGRELTPRLPRSQAREAQDLRLLLGLGEAFAGAGGFASKPAGEAYFEALERARRLGASDELLRSFTGLFGFLSMGGRFGEAREVAERFHALATERDLVLDRMVSHRVLGVVMFMTGELEGARDHLEASLDLYDRCDAAERARAMINAQDQRSTTLAYLPLALGVLGDPARAEAMSELGIAHSEGLGHLHSIGYSLTFATGLGAVLRTPPAAFLRLARRTMEFAREHQFPNWRMARVFFGYALAQQGACEEGLAEMLEGLSSYGATGGVVFAPVGLHLLARAQGLAGRGDDALGTFDRAIGVARRTGERWCVAEILGGRAEALADAGRGEEAAAHFEQALDEARAIGARLFELRAAIGRARLHREAGEPGSARELLEPLCFASVPQHSFRELVTARELLERCA